MSRLPPGKLRVAFSGGMDSTVLLHATAERLREEGDLKRLTAHHLNHQLHPESAAWAEHCQRFAEQIGVSFDCDVLRISRKGNMEHLAREARYAKWSQVLAEGETLLLAHHARDQAETLLMRLMRGAGGYLLRGMPRERDFAEGGLMRPFLHLPHEAIEGYAKTHGLEWCEDPSNREVDKDRNFLRLKVLPLLIGRWPGAVTSLARSSEFLDREHGVVDALLAGPVEEVLKGGEGICVDALLSLPLEVQVPTLRRALVRMDVHSLSDSHLSEILRQVSLPTDQRLDFALGKGRSLARFAGRLMLCRPRSVKADERYVWKLQETMNLPHGQLVVSAEGAQKAFCLPAEIRELEIRFRSGGERLRVRGMSRKVSRLFQEAGIAPWLRPGWPLLYFEGRLVALPGIAVDDALSSDRGWLIEWSPN